MTAIFPYIKREGQFYPVIDLMLKGKSTSLEVNALVDSGASISVFDAEIAEYLDIDIEKGKRIYLEGIGGRILGYIHYVYIIVDQKRFRCKIVFSWEFTAAFNLIGRDNFFKHFLITFDEKNKRTVLKS
ncbi:MAG: retroviral-like aspartic protease [Bacteroidetes bacterium]|nr:retroviral-like aspartic protease [Bacteroidota bacterium]